jgi:predicted O-linked N-acetylglucosamine transferase (SPINDLY family)
MLVRFGSGFSLDCGEELRSHEFDRSLKHALADTRYRAADLRFAAIIDHCYAVTFLEINIASAFQKPRLTLPVHNYSKMARWRQVFEPNVAGENPFNRTDSCAKRRRVSILSSLLESLATGYAALQHPGVG